MERNALCREESAQLPARLSPSTDKFSRRSLQPAAPTAVRSLSPRFLFTDDRRRITSPMRIRDGTRRDVTTRAANRSLQTQLGGAHAPQTLLLIAHSSLLRHAGASATQVDGAEFREDAQISVTKHQRRAGREETVSITAKSL